MTLRTNDRARTNTFNRWTAKRIHKRKIGNWRLRLRNSPSWHRICFIYYWLSRILILSSRDSPLLHSILLTLRLRMSNWQLRYCGDINNYLARAPNNIAKHGRTRSNAHHLRTSRHCHRTRTTLLHWSAIPTAHPPHTYWSYFWLILSVRRIHYRSLHILRRHVLNRHDLSRLSLRPSTH